MKKKFSVKIQNKSIKKNDNKVIKILSDIIKQRKNEKLSIEEIFQQPETFLIIKMILSKYQKDENDIFILINYLQTLKSFMSSILQSQPSDFDPIPLLKEISKDLQCEEYPKNSFVMKVGEIGKKFYISLSGFVSILVPKKYNVIMTKNQYINHLKTLNKFDEKYLLEKTYYNNLGNFPDLILDNILKEKKKKKKKNKKNKNYYGNNELEEIKEEKKEEQFSDIVKNLIEENNKNDNIENEKNEKEENKKEEEEEIKFTLQSYLKIINGEYIEQKNKIIPTYEIQLLGYFKVTDLNQGSCFGEYALINDNNQRTASIFVNENSIFGILTVDCYKISLKNIQEYNKKNDVEFIFSSQLFNQITIFYFTQNYWNFFIKRKIQKDDHIFNQEKEREEIYFLEEGEFLLYINRLTFKKTNLYLSQIGNIKFDKIDYDDIGKEINVNLSYAKRGDILGLNDIIYDNKFICSAICISKKATYFAINFNIFKNICSTYPKVFESWKKMDIDKRILMFQRLNNIKYSNKNSLKGEFRKKDENIKFWNIEDELYKTFEVEKKYSKINEFNTSYDFNIINKINIKDKTLSKISPQRYFNNSNKLRNSLPPIRTPIQEYKFNTKLKKIKIKDNKSPFNSYTNTDNILITQPSFKSTINTDNNKSQNEQLIIKRPDLSILELKKNVIKNNKKDLISKIILGHNINENDVKNDNYYFFNPENSDELIKKKIKIKLRKTKPITFFNKIKYLGRNNLLLNDLSKNNKLISKTMERQNLNLDIVSD